MTFSHIIWHMENLDFRRTFPRHGRIEASFILLIWLTENLPVISG